VFKLGEVQQGGTKDELIPAVVRHWKQTIVDEDETLIAFVTALRQRAKRGNIQAVNNRHSSFKTNSTRSGPRGKGK
jgi:histone deacetylase complex subunit SAP30